MPEIVAKDPASPRGRILRSAKYLAEHIGEAPVLIFACVKRYNDRQRAGEPMQNAMFPAIQNLCLAARGHGLGKWLVEVVVETARGANIRRVLLATRDAHGLYGSQGFVRLAEPERWLILQG